MTRLTLLIVLATQLCTCERQQSRSGVRVVRRDPQVFLGSGSEIGIRRVPPRDDGDPGMLEYIKQSIGDYSGPIAYLGQREKADQRFGQYEKQIKVVDARPFDARDTAPADKALSQMKAGYLLVSTLDPTIAPWPTPNLTKIHHLLRDGVPPPGFQPVVVGRAHILYRIAPSLEISADQQRSITNYIRTRLRGQDAPALETPPDVQARASDGKVRIIVWLRLPNAPCTSGRQIARRLGEGDTFREALDSVVMQLTDRWGRTQRSSKCRNQLSAQLSSAMERMTIQVEVVHRLAPISDRTLDRLYYLVELGREGVYLKRGNTFSFISPVHIIYRSMTTERNLVKRLGSWNDLSADTWRDEDYEFGRFETISWIETEPSGEVEALYRGVPLISPNSITRERIVEALVRGAHFLARNQTKQGEYRYVYRPLEDENERWTTDNNIVRHSLCPMVVAKAHQLAPDPVLQESAKRGIDFTLSHLQRSGDRCAIEFHGAEGDRPNRKMGTVAAMVLSILVLGRTTNIEEYRDELQCLGNQIIAMQEPSGRFTHYDVPRSHPYYGRYNTIYPGELMYALSMLYEWSGDVRYRAAFDRAFRYQQNWFRETRSQTREDGIYDESHRIDLISFEPWGIMALNDMYRQVGETGYADFAFELVEFMDGLFHWNFGRAQYADYLGGYFKTQLEAPAINSCGYTEGAAAAFAIALRSGRNIEERRLSLLLGLRFVLQLQYRPGRSDFHLPDPATASGGFRYNLVASRVRNDYMYHALNALALAAVSLREEDYPPNVTFENIPEILEPAFETH